VSLEVQRYIILYSNLGDDMEHEHLYYSFDDSGGSYRAHVVVDVPNFPELTVLILDQGRS